MKTVAKTKLREPFSTKSPVHATTHGVGLQAPPNFPTIGNNLPESACKPNQRHDISQPTAAYGGRIKYTEEVARRYQVRKQDKHLAEMSLIDRAFTLIPKSHRVLDVPCGGGRVSLHLSGRGYAMSLGDLSPAMLGFARENVAGAGLKCSVELQDIEALSCGDRAFDTIVSFRLFHHFPNPEIRHRAVRELCRAAGQFVVLSYSSTQSITAVRRKLQVALGGKMGSKYSTPLSEVRGYFEAAGFELVKDFSEMPIIHTLHLAVFKRHQ